MAKGSPATGEAVIERLPGGFAGSGAKQNLPLLEKRFEPFIGGRPPSGCCGEKHDSKG
jgi:hypothetical protein